MTRGAVLSKRDERCKFCDDVYDDTHTALDCVLLLSARCYKYERVLEAIADHCDSSHEEAMHRAAKALE